MVVDKLSQALTAISDPTRRALVARLAQGQATVNDLAAPFKISQQAISKHLAVLARAGLITKRKDGRRQICELNWVPLHEVDDWITPYRALWEESLDRLGEFLKESQQTSKPEPVTNKKNRNSKP